MRAFTFALLTSVVFGLFSQAARSGTVDHAPHDCQYTEMTTNCPVSTN